MAPIGSRRSERGKHARDKEKEESTEGEVRDKDAEGTVEDSLGPGSNPDLAHGSSGVHKTPVKKSSAKQPSEADGTRGSRSEDHSMPSRRDFGEQSRPSGPRLSFATPGSAPYKHAIPHGNTTPTNASPSATRPKAAPIPQVATGSHLAEARSRHILRALRQRRSTAQVLRCGSTCRSISTARWRPPTSSWGRS